MDMTTALPSRLLHWQLAFPRACQWNGRAAS